MFDDVTLDVSQAVQVHWMLKAIEAASRDDGDAFVSIIASHDGSATDVLDMSRWIGAAAASCGTTYDEAAAALRDRATRAIEGAQGEPPHPDSHRNGSS